MFRRHDHRAGVVMGEPLRPDLTDMTIRAGHLRLILGLVHLGLGAAWKHLKSGQTDKARALIESQIATIEASAKGVAQADAVIGERLVSPHRRRA